MIDTHMNGEPYKAGRHIATLRRELWREHLGLLPAQDYDASKCPNSQPPNTCGNQILEGTENDFVIDPLDDKLWDMWTQRATTNTEMFRVLFRADPDDNIRTFEDYDKFTPRGAKQGHLFDPYQPVQLVREQLDKIKGHLVWMPLDFLKDAEMAEPGLQVNQFTEVGFFFFLFLSLSCFIPCPIPWLFPFYRMGANLNRVFTLDTGVLYEYVVIYVIFLDYMYLDCKCHYIRI